MEIFRSTLAKIDGICQSNGLRYAVIGGVAVMFYLSERVTADIDLIVQTEIGDFEKTYQAFADNGFLALKPTPIKFFEQNFVSPMQDSTTKIKTDISAAVSGFEQQSIDRAKRVAVAGTTFNVVTVEDLVLFKLFARRPKDMLDAQSLIKKMKAQLDKTYLQKTAKAFAELERGDILGNLNQLLDS